MEQEVKEIEVVENVEETTSQEKKGFVNKIKGAFKKKESNDESIKAVEPKKWSTAKKLVVGTTGLLATTVIVTTIYCLTCNATDMTDVIENVSEELSNAEE